MTAIHVTYDGDTHWLECFADDPNAEHGDIIGTLDAGDKWDDLCALVFVHQSEHGCAPAEKGTPS